MKILNQNKLRKNWIYVSQRQGYTYQEIFYDIFIKINQSKLIKVIEISQKMYTKKNFLFLKAKKYVINSIT